jgi:hypothetical protein
VSESTARRANGERLTAHSENAGRVGYAITPGLTLELHDRILCPSQVVAALRKDEMSRESSRNLVNLDL